MAKSEWQHSVWVPLLESHSRASHSSFYTWHLFLVLIYVTTPEQINLISTVTCLKQSKLISLLSEEKKLWQEVHRMSFGPSRTNNRQANKKSQRTNLGTLGPRPLGSISLLCRANLILSKGFPILSMIFCAATNRMSDVRHIFVLSPTATEGRISGKRIKSRMLPPLS